MRYHRCPMSVVSLVVLIILFVLTAPAQAQFSRAGGLSIKRAPAVAPAAGGAETENASDEANQGMGESALYMLLQGYAYKDDSSIVGCPAGLHQPGGEDVPAYAVATRIGEPLPDGSSLLLVDVDLIDEESGETSRLPLVCPDPDDGGIPVLADQRYQVVVAVAPKNMTYDVRLIVGSQGDEKPVTKPIDLSYLLHHMEVPGLPEGEVEPEGPEVQEPEVEAPEMGMEADVQKIELDAEEKNAIDVGRDTPGIGEGLIPGDKFHIGNDRRVGVGLGTGFMPGTVPGGGQTSDSITIPGQNIPGGGNEIGGSHNGIVDNDVEIPGHGIDDHFSGDDTNDTVPGNVNNEGKMIPGDTDAPSGRNDGTGPDGKTAADWMNNYSPGDDMVDTSGQETNVSNGIEQGQRGAGQGSDLAQETENKIDSTRRGASEGVVETGEEWNNEGQTTTEVIIGDESAAYVDGERMDADDERNAIADAFSGPVASNLDEGQSSDDDDATTGDDDDATTGDDDDDDDDTTTATGDDDDDDDDDSEALPNPYAEDESADGSLTPADIMWWRMQVGNGVGWFLQTISGGRFGDPIEDVEETYDTRPAMNRIGGTLGDKGDIDTVDEDDDDDTGVVAPMTPEQQRELIESGGKVGPRVIEGHRSNMQIERK